VSIRSPRKTSVHLRIDPKTFAFFHAVGEGRLTRRAKVLKVYAQRHRNPSRFAENWVR
jgi:uncharacterized protein (DUF4415 family)